MKFALETPDSASFEGGVDSVPRWPDGVIYANWLNDAYDIAISYLARDLRASNGVAPIASAYGWGASLQGRLYLPDFVNDDYVVFSLTKGAGIGDKLNDVPPTAIYDATTNTLQTLDTTGWFLGYQHYWSQRYATLVTYSEVKQDNLAIQPSTDFHKTTYASINFVWIPDPRWILGGEILSGSREDKDGTKATDTRVQITSRFNF